MENLTIDSLLTTSLNHLLESLGAFALWAWASNVYKTHINLYRLLFHGYLHATRRKGLSSNENFDLKLLTNIHGIFSLHIQYSFLSLYQSFHEKSNKTRKFSKSAIFEWYENGRRRLLSAQSINGESFLNLHCGMDESNILYFLPRNYQQLRNLGKQTAEV